ncbi:hypothetical protein [Aquibacillus salsiterrae]|uniref:Uncharacterized protein n=1 Tax=Aquibacillus salsiterrae TaxID=2950439 RepID=A0A9X3WK78_9BACI|nr:hypothetical protein [Aquibacillus salsiterrae]MDC3418606.1 hypothetical protein [Aquibacillus salsiterrae]
MRKPPFGYEISYNSRLRKDWYYVVEDMRHIVHNIFLDLRYLNNLDSISKSLNCI